MHPTSLRGDTRQVHYARGKIVGWKSADVAIVQIPKHKRPEPIEIKYLKLWKSRNASKP